MLIFFLVFINHQYMYCNSWPIPACHLTYFCLLMHQLTTVYLQYMVCFNISTVYSFSYLLKHMGFLHLGIENKKMFIKTRKVDGPLTMPIEYYLKSLWFVGGFYLGV